MTAKPDCQTSVTGMIGIQTYSECWAYDQEMRMKYFIEQPAVNPLMRVFAAAVAAIALAVAVFFGAVVFVVMTGLLLVLGAAVWMRCWWLGRQLRSGHKPSATSGRPGDSVIEAEYRVVSRRED